MPTIGVAFDGRNTMQAARAQAQAAEAAGAMLYVRDARAVDPLITHLRDIERAALN